MDTLPTDIQLIVYKYTDNEELTKVNKFFNGYYNYIMKMKLKCEYNVIVDLHEAIKIYKQFDDHTKNELPFWQVAEKGYIHVVKHLLYGASQKELDNALINSAKKGHINIVDLLLAKGANIHADDNCALQLSAINGYIDVVKLLINKGANVHAYYNSISLHYTAFYGQADVIKLLLGIHPTQKIMDEAIRGINNNRNNRDGHLVIIEYIESLNYSIEKLYECNKERYKKRKRN